jgi:hypothetical protein
MLVSSATLDFFAMERRAERGDLTLSPACTTLSNTADSSAGNVSSRMNMSRTDRCDAAHGGQGTNEPPMPADDVELPLACDDEYKDGEGER